MKSTVAVFVHVALLVASSASLAATSLPAEGSYGFDWLRDPGSVQCKPIGKALMSQFRKCEVTDGSFGGEPVQARKCTIDKRSEYMVYDSKAACMKSLETERSNE